MSSTSVLVQARLGWVRRDLQEAIDRLDQGLVGWAPAEGMRTVGGQLIEIAATEFQVLTMLKGGSFVPDEEVLKMIPDPSRLEDLVSFLGSVREGTVGYIDGLSGEELEEEVDGVGWRMGLAAVPRSEVLRSIAQHEAYHVGQLFSYLWARGDHPYRW